MHTTVYLLAPESIRMLFFVYLCLLWMSEDANSVSETLHVRQNIGTVLHDFSVDGRTIIRRLEGLLKKHNNARYAVIFTDTCIKENLLPKFTNIRLYDQAVQQNEHALAFRKDLLKEEARKKKRVLEDIAKKLKEVSESYQELNVAESLRHQTDAILQDLAETHERVVRTRILRKLSSLYGAQVNLPEHEDGFINLSSYELLQE